MRRCLVGLVAGVLGVVGSVLGPIGAPQEAVALKLVSKTYSQQQFKSSVLGVCVRLTAQGTMTALYGITANQVYLNSPAVVEPRAYAAVLANCGTHVRKKISKITLTSEYYYWKCEAQPTLAVSAPLGVSVSATPTCGSERVARNTSSFGSGSDYSQYSTGGRARWNRSSYNFTKATLCTHITGTTTIYVGNKSDKLSFDLGNACVSSS